MPYHTYIARCSDDTLYTGYCVDIEAREEKHNSGKGAKYTRNRRPVKIVYSESFLNRSDAMKRESAIKKLTRMKKEALIKDSKSS